jgi:hypothetical protein
VIHPYYNTWVAALERDIAAAIAGLTASERSEQPSGDGTAPKLVADELRKLNSLVEDGIITREEFDSQKSRLLGE